MVDFNKELVGGYLLVGDLLYVFVGKYVKKVFEYYKFWDVLESKLV